MPSAKRKDERFEIRLSTDDKRLLVEAATLRGMTPSEFAVKVMRRAAERTVERVRTLRYSRRDQIAMIEALLHPGVPNEKLRKAWKRYDKVVGTR